MKFEHFLKQRNPRLHEELTGSAVAVPSSAQPAQQVSNAMKNLNVVSNNINMQAKQLNNPVLNQSAQTLQKSVNDLNTSLRMSSTVAKNNQNTQQNLDAINRMQANTKQNLNSLSAPQR